MDTTERADADDGDVEDDGTEQAIAVPDTRNLIAGSADPRTILTRAIEQANALADIIERKKLYVTINGRRHVTVDGWVTLGALNDLWPYTESVQVDSDAEGNLRATAIVQARTGRGAVIARAEGFCSTREARWHGRDEYAVRSMAQTRATSKVFRQPLAWILALAGYESTPAEEREPGERPDARIAAEPEKPSPPAAGPALDDPSPDDSPIRVEAIRLWNAHPKEAAAYVRANSLPQGVAAMTMTQVRALREHLLAFRG